MLTERFEQERPKLRAVAYRMLGSAAEADDAVQEAWLRLSRTDADGVDNLGAWLTTVVGRICLDTLRSRTSRREDGYAAEPSAPQPGPEEQALLADAVGVALLVVLDTLTPTERLAFVLHDLFGVPFEEIAPIVGRSPAAARQLASRARRRVRADPPSETPSADRRLVEAFLTASRDGQFATLLTLLDPDVEMRIDSVVARTGADAVARYYDGLAKGARPALVDGHPGFAVTLDGQLIVTARLTFRDGRIALIEATLHPDRDQLAEL